MKKNPYHIIVLIFVISLASIGLELTITRIFSLIFSYYYLFLAVSIAMCGLGVGGFLISMGEYKESNLMVMCCLLALTYITAVVMPLKVVFFLSHPLILSIAFILPFLTTGMVVSLIFKLYHHMSGYVYFADLLGAGLGALAIIGMLSIFSPINVIFVFASVIIIATFIAFWKTSILAAAVITSVFVVLNWNHRLLDIPYRRIPLSYSTKALITLIKDGKAGFQIEHTYWSPSFRTDVICRTLEPNTRGIFIDGSAPTIMFKYDGDLNSVKWLRNTINYVPFSVVRPETALCIGSGGGLDVLLGLLADFKRIEAVEVNECMPKVLRDYKYFIDGLFENDRVIFRLCEGRSYLKKSRQTYDLIYLACAQTKTSCKTGVPLVESYLHTTDAYMDYLQHLKPDGMIGLLCETKPFLQRTIFNIIFALKQMGISVEESSNHFLIIANSILDSPYKYLVLIRKTRFTIDQARLIYKNAEEKGLFAQHIPYIYNSDLANFSSEFAVEQYLEEMRKTHEIDLSPTTDEKPLFYDLSLNAPPFLYWICISTLIISIAALLLIRPRTGVIFPLNFIMLGAGFMMIEVSLTQKFLFYLGRPLTAFSVIILGLLSGSGIGGFMSQKIKNTFRKLPMLLLVLCSIILLLFFFLGNFFHATCAFSDLWKCSLSLLVLIILGFFMGIPFPVFIRKIGEISVKDIGYLWGVNGLMAVFGSSFSIIISKIHGIKYSLLFAFFIYAIVLLLDLMLKRRYKE